MSFDDVLRRALVDAAGSDFESVLSADILSTPVYSRRYLYRKKHMLADPFHYAKHMGRTFWQRSLSRVAVILLILSILFGSAMLIPEVRAVITRVVTSWFDTHTTYEFTGAESGDSKWYPVYLPKGFVETLYDDAFGSVTICFENGDAWITLDYLPTEEGGSISMDHEHTDLTEIQVSNRPAQLYRAKESGGVSYVVWTSAGDETLFVLSATIGEAELIFVAESVRLIS